MPLRCGYECSLEDHAQLNYRDQAGGNGVSGAAVTRSPALRLFFRRQLGAIFEILTETRHDRVDDHLNFFRCKFIGFRLA